LHLCARVQPKFILYDHSLSTYRCYCLYDRVIKYIFQSFKLIFTPQNVISDGDESTHENERDTLWGRRLGILGTKDGTQSRCFSTRTVTMVADMDEYGLASLRISHPWIKATTRAQDVFCSEV